VDAWTYVDGFGRALQTQRADVTASRVVSSKAYNALGQLLYDSAPYATSGSPGSGYVAPSWPSLASYHAFTYDERGNLKKDETFSGNTALWSTQTLIDGWTKSVYDANGNRTDYASDAFGRLTQVTEYAPATQSTFYSYNGRDDLTQVTDAASNITTIAYDLLSRKTSMTDPDMGTWNYGYDANGNLTSQQDARGWWLYLEYDGLNRLVRKRRDATTGTVLAEWNYDAAGQKGLLASSVAYSPLGAVQVSNMSYDARNRLTQQQWSIPTQGAFRFDYGYNEASQQTTLRYPGGNAGQQGELVTKGYYAQTGQFNTASSDDGTQFVAYTSYNPLGQVIEQRNDSGTNGVMRRVTYDSATLRTNRIYAGSGSGASTNLQDLSLTFDNNGNIKSLTDAINSGQKQCFGYDSLNRLTSAFTGDAGCSSFVNSGVGAYNHSYSYNAIGNITNNAGNAYTYGSSMPHAVTAAFGNSYGYDANGNQTSRTIGGVAYALTFDYDNRITEVKQGATTLGTFVYDADGNRVLGTVGSVTTAYIAGLYEWQADATTKYYEGGGMRRSGYAANNGISYVLGDQLGSTSVIVGQSGIAQATNYYFPFGGNRGGGAFSDLTTKRFTGQYHESNLPGGEGLSYYNARWYDAQIGRFVSPDTVVPGTANPQAFNRFSYAFNSPSVYRDSRGHDPRDDFGNNMNDDCSYAGKGCSGRPNPVLSYYAKNPAKLVNAHPGHLAVLKYYGYRAVKTATGILVFPQVGNLFASSASVTWAASYALPAIFITGLVGLTAYSELNGLLTFALPRYPVPAYQTGEIQPTYLLGGAATLTNNSSPAGSASSLQVNVSATYLPATLTDTEGNKITGARPLSPKEVREKGLHRAKENMDGYGGTGQIWVVKGKSGEEYWVTKEGSTENAEPIYPE
jgi:RHS repeat-associated protein